jgi:hypothetical protein
MGDIIANGIQLRRKLTDSTSNPREAKVLTVNTGSCLKAA